jgi:AcrR family transcriptional regulator
MTDRVTRKKQITERRQTEILKAAGDIFARKGYAAATIPEIARSAGLASGTVYLYFPSKRDLFIATIRQWMIAPLLRIFENESNLNFSDLINMAITDRLELMQQEAFPRLITFIGEIVRDEELNSIYVEKLVRPFLSRMENTYRKHISTGEFRKIEPDILVRLIGSTIIGLIILRVLEGNASPFNRINKEQLAVEIRDYVLFGITGKSNAPLTGER